jgi:hypothetical protein
MCLAWERYFLSDDVVEIYQGDFFDLKTDCVSYEICAKQMKQAYDDIWKCQIQFPKSLTSAYNNHKLLSFNNLFSTSNMCFIG